jgi:zinc protease
VEELGKAIKQFISGTLASRKTMQGQAQNLGGSWMAAHDLNFSARYLEAVKRTTPAEIQRVARQYLTHENRTLYALLPAGTARRTVDREDVEQEKLVQKFELSNGLRLLVKESHRLPFVEIRALFKGGVLRENAANNGLTLLMSKMLLKGTPTRSAKQLANEIESVGGHLDTYSASNSFGVTRMPRRNPIEHAAYLVANLKTWHFLKANPSAWGTIS